MKIGIDIVEINRIKNFVDTNSETLLRIFSEEEIKYCSSKKHKKSQYQSYAARFAAKEAVIKALNDKSINLHEISVQNTNSGKPSIKIHNKQYENLNIQVSLSHCDNYAIAMVVI